MLLYEHLFPPLCPTHTDSEEMDTSPTMPCKRLNLGYTSPASTANNHSPGTCSSPLMGNSPLHYSFTTSATSRKSSDCTPLSSPSSLNPTNPFAVNYDSGNCEHWQSGGSAGSSRGQSPLNASVKVDGRTVSLEDVMKHSPGLLISDEHRGILLESPEITTEAPTPLSPKGLQFRHKPFPLATSSLPSPIPRNPQLGGPPPSCASNSTAIMVSTSSCTSQRSNPIPIPKHGLHHDKLHSPFTSGPELHLPPLAHARIIRRKGQLYHSTSNLGTARQMNRLDTSRPLAPYHHHHIPHTDQRHTQQVPNQLGISSPLSRQCVGPITMDEGSTIGNSSLVGSSMEQRVIRLGRRRRESETSNDSREDSFMESDSSVVSSLEESLELCEGGKEYDGKVVTTISS